MDRLSSCYFCRTALDAPLTEYSVDDSDVPTTVTLCPTCSHKLNTVFEVIGVEPLIQTAADSSENPVEESSESATVQEPTIADTDGQVESTDSGDAETEDDASVTVESAEAESTHLEEEPSDTEPAVEDLVDPAVRQADELTEQTQEPGEELTAEMDARHPDEQAEPVEGETTDEAMNMPPSDDEGRTIDDLLEENMDADIPEPFETAEESTAENELDSEAGRNSEDLTVSQPNDEHSGNDKDVDGESVDEKVASRDDQQEMTTDIEESPTAAFTEEGEDSDDSSEPTEEQPRTTISALEYNKVMRLLQNREFPVERAEIETVAASAYNLSEQECAEVIDLAVDRELLKESEGMLKRPS